METETSAETPTATIADPAASVERLQVERELRMQKRRVQILSAWRPPARRLRRPS